MGTYQMQTNLSVQTIYENFNMCHWINIQGVWGDWLILQSEAAIVLGNHTFANPPSHLSAPLPLDVDLMTQI